MTIPKKVLNRVDELRQCMVESSKLKEQYCAAHKNERLLHDKVKAADDEYVKAYRSLDEALAEWGGVKERCFEPI